MCSKNVSDIYVHCFANSFKTRFNLVRYFFKKGIEVILVIESIDPVRPYPGVVKSLHF